MTNGKIPLGRMKESEYRECVDSLGLLEGEEIRLEYVCFRHKLKEEKMFTSMWGFGVSKPLKELRRGLLVFTNDNMIFVQHQGHHFFGQELRIPLEQISGVVEKPN